MNKETGIQDTQRNAIESSYILESEAELKDFILGFSKMLNFDGQDSELKAIKNIKNSMFCASNKDSANQKLKLDSPSALYLLNQVAAENLNISPKFKSILEFRLSSIFALKESQLPIEFQNNSAIKRLEFQRTYSRAEQNQMVKA